MSLTRDEWEKMWFTVEVIESLAESLTRNKRLGDSVRTGKAIELQCSKIKRQIESVIGQMG